MTPHVLQWIDFGVKLDAAKKVTVAEEGREERKADYTEQYRWGKEEISQGDRGAQRTKLDR